MYWKFIFFLTSYFSTIVHWFVIGNTQIWEAKKMSLSLSLRRKVKRAFSISHCVGSLKSEKAHANMLTVTCPIFFLHGEVIWILKQVNSDMFLNWFWVWDWIINSIKFILILFHSPIPCDMTSYLPSILILLTSWKRRKKTSVLPRFFKVFLIIFFIFFLHFNKIRDYLSVRVPFYYFFI